MKELVTLFDQLEETAKQICDKITEMHESGLLTDVETTPALLMVMKYPYGNDVGPSVQGCVTGMKPTIIRAAATIFDNEQGKGIVAELFTNICL